MTAPEEHSSSAPQQPSSGPQTQQPAIDPAQRFRRRLVFAMLCLAGLIARLAALALAPEHAFLSDHVDYMAWSHYAYEHGPTSVYDAPAGNLINVNLPPWLFGRRVTMPFPSYSRCNYPPLAAYAFWGQGFAWSLLEPQPATLKPHPEIAAEVGYTGGPVTSRIANTVPARLANSFLALLTDFLWAFGVAKLVQRLRPQWPAAGTWAFGIALLAPPVFINSAFWNQTDSWLACGMVWTIYLLTTNRYAAAGVVYGATALIKAQAVLLAPVLVYAFVGLALSRSQARLRRALPAFVGAAVVTVVVLAAPFSVRDAGGGEMGWARWIYRSYLEPIQSDFPYTTLKAFNVWWLDQAAHGGTREALDAHAQVFGFSKDAVGRTLLIVALLALALLCARRAGWSPAAWQFFAALALLAVFLLPTRAHERYLYYALPFIIAGALLFRRWLPMLIAVLLVATFEMTWYLWYSPAFARPWDPPANPRAAAWSVLLALLLVSAFAYGVITLWRNRTVGLAAGRLDRIEAP